MIRPATAAVALGLIALTAVPAAIARVGGEAAAPKPCKTGVVGGATVNTWCGPAKATVELAGKSYSFKGGLCGLAQGTWSINVGKFTSPPAKPKLAYFGAAGSKGKPGNYPEQRAVRHLAPAPRQGVCPPGRACLGASVAQGDDRRERQEGDLLRTRLPRCRSNRSR